MKDLNEKIVSEINSKLPKNISAVNYLMDLLFLGKESAYRRLKSQIPFTLEEAAAIANDLGFSLDKIVETKEGSRVFFDMQTDFNKSSSELYLDLLRGDVKTIKELNSTKDVKITSALNRIPLRFLQFDHLFKFIYCRYLHSKGDISMAVNFSDIIVPPEIVELRKELIYNFNRLNNITCILNDNMFSKVIKSIQYCYRTGIVGDEDFRLLQKDMFDLLAFIEKLVTKGVNDYGCSYSFYYSLIELEADCICYEYDNSTMLQIWLFPESPIIIKENRLMYKIFHEWINSKIKYSTLITKSNDLLQSRVIRELYEQTSNMDKRFMPE